MRLYKAIRNRNFNLLPVSHVCLINSVKTDCWNAFPLPLCICMWYRVRKVFSKTLFLLEWKALSCYYNKYHYLYLTNAAPNNFECIHNMHCSLSIDIGFQANKLILENLVGLPFTRDFLQVYTFLTNNRRTKQTCTNEDLVSYFQGATKHRCISSRFYKNV